jgi:hypothetical protein
VLAALFAAFAVSASDNDQIIQTVTEYRLAAMGFDFEKALSLCTPDYVEYSADGTRRTVKDLQNMMQAFRTLESSNDLEVVLECAMKLQGATLSAAQRQQIRSVKGTPREAQALAAVKQQLTALRTQMRNLRPSLMNMLKIGAVTVNGNEATAIQEFTEPGTGKKHVTRYKLRKSGNRWMICELREENPA